MDPVDVSRLLYLVEAIEAAPARGRDLVRLAAKRDGSNGYRTAVKQLDDVADDALKLSQVSASLKRTLR